MDGDSGLKVTQLVKNIYIYLYIYFFFFTESEGPLSCSQKSVTGSYPNPVQSSPHPHTIVFKLHFNIICTPTPGLPTGLFPQCLLAKLFYVFLISQVYATLLAHFILLHLVTLTICQN
jgi:hypothetical protein